MRSRIFRSLAPELSDEVNPRTLVTCCLEGGDELVIRVEAQDIASLRAALNMYLARQRCRGDAGSRQVESPSFPWKPGLLDPVPACAGNNPFYPPE